MHTVQSGSVARYYLERGRALAHHLLQRPLLRDAGAAVLLLQLGLLPLGLIEVEGRARRRLGTRCPATSRAKELEAATATA